LISCNSGIKVILPHAQIPVLNFDFTVRKSYRISKLCYLPITPLWIKKQKKIVKLGLTVYAGFFSVNILEAVQLITKNLRGADPDNINAEKQWLKNPISYLLAILIIA
jgi:hypothetical protein